MEELIELFNLIGNFGFPIVISVVLLIFLIKTYNKFSVSLTTLETLVRQLGGKNEDTEV